MAATPILALCDELAAVIAAAWSPAPPSAVARAYLTPARAEAIEGRQVWVFPAAYTDSPATRAEDEARYRVAVVVAERYEEAGEPPVAWVDDRVDFVSGTVVETLDFTRDLLAFAGRRVWTAEMDEVPVYDPALLLQKKLFWSAFEVVFSEIATA